ncbi:MAG: DUF2157 domain-containing protein [Vicinamibacterales bacterium]
MTLSDKTAALVSRWKDAGVVDEPTAERILAFEREREASASFGWPVKLALAFGALLLGAGALLFVSAHWDALSPSARFVIVLASVAGMHLAAVAAASGFPSLTKALHAVGTVMLGAGIFLSGQIFNLQEHWPGGILLWAFGAGAAWRLLGHSPQLALFAVLAPAWLAGEWIEATDPFESTAQRVLASGLLLLALAYFTVDRESRDRAWSTLFWIGGLAVPPTAAYAAVTAAERRVDSDPTAGWLLGVGWCLAIGLPLALLGATRIRDWWIGVAACAWVAVLSQLGALPTALGLYLWWVLGGSALALWGVRDARPERVNMGVAIFAATVVAFYFSEVMDRLDRSAGLFAFGLLFLAGGWALERARRGLVGSARSHAS